MEDLLVVHWTDCRNQHSCMQHCKMRAVLKAVLKAVRIVVPELPTEEISTIQKQRMFTALGRGQKVLEISLILLPPPALLDFVLLLH
jgi:hypothetical protein